MAATAGIQRRSQLIERLADARARTDEIFDILAPNAYYERPIPERHRNVFYLGHLEAFDWNLFSASGLKLAPFNTGFDKLFAFGIDPVGGGLPDDQPGDWPAVEEIRRYNTRVRETLDATIKAHPAAAEFSGFTLSTILSAAIEHRLMHAETFAYMLNQLPLGGLIAPPRAEPPAADPVNARMADIPAGEAKMGLDRTNAGKFGWDNEFDAHRVIVPEFSMDVFPVTNGDFLKFIEAGGYEQRGLWTEKGWEWISRDGIRKPAFWRDAGGEWLLRTMFSETTLPRSWPVYVSHAEASAYARWKGKRLPTEAEWQRAAYGAPERAGEREYPWGNEPPDTERGNFNFNQWDPAPVNAHPAGASAFGTMDLLGNGWEWTSSVFEPFPGFKPYPFYPGYSANFFDGQHYVMKGGSPRTAACMLRRSFRNWFQPNYPYVYATFRCVAR